MSYRSWDIVSRIQVFCTFNEHNIVDCVCLVCSISQSYLISSVWTNDNEVHRELIFTLEARNSLVWDFKNYVPIQVICTFLRIGPLTMFRVHCIICTLMSSHYTGGKCMTQSLNVCPLHIHIVRFGRVSERLGWIVTGFGGPATLLCRC